ncbi:MAG TPA: metal ABC transporter ATP-binding protein [Candidatus Limnocylindrales bacterium]|nr:metal ABC transporter ATP-binding protein [Candidatus Limnocylindrales bacterium]
MTAPTPQPSPGPGPGPGPGAGDITADGTRDGAPGPAHAHHAGHHHAPHSIRLTDVTVGYDTRPVLEDVDLELAPGALTAVVGPNGGGKSTLLKLIAGVLEPWSGTIEVLGGPPGRHARSVAYVPQAETVDWGFPVGASDVVMMGRYPRLGPLRRPRPADHRAVAQALDLVGMADLARRQIGALSGGQRRRVFLARALASEPELYLLDEPVTGVDNATQEDLMAVLDAEARAGKTVIATTHDLASAAEHFRSIVAVNRTIVAQGDASLVLDADVLLRTYGGHLLYVGERAAVLDDAHHHDDAPRGEVHHHDEEGPRPARRRR